MLVELLVEHAEFADFIVVNMAVLLDETDLKRLEGIQATFNPGAEIVRATHGQSRSTA